MTEDETKEKLKELNQLEKEYVMAKERFSDLDRELSKKKDEIVKTVVKSYGGEEEEDEGED